MTEILTTGLKGLQNRINLFASIQQNDVMDVTCFANEVPNGSAMTSQRVMITSRTESLLFTGQNITPLSFLSTLAEHMGVINTKEEYDSLKKIYHPEFNTITNQIGEGYRKIGNTVMLLSRAEYHTKKAQDLYLYEYYMTLLENGSIIEG